ncbi:MAG: hypothetical protein ACM3XZ_03745 [Betaproteobacteria bacterium]
MDEGRYERRIIDQWSVLLYGSVGVLALLFFFVLPLALGPAVGAARSLAGLLRTAPVLLLFLAVSLWGVSWGIITLTADDQGVSVRYGFNWHRADFCYRDIVRVFSDRTPAVFRLHGRWPSWFSWWRYPFPWLGCVELTIEREGRRETYRIPTDDPHGLHAFLRSHLEQRQPG